jgi:lipid-binding SYLF domain-containing protein
MAAIAGDRGGVFFYDMRKGPATGQDRAQTEANEAGKHMSNLTRRGFTLGTLAGVPALAACGNGVGSPGGAKIDARVNATLDHMYANYPGTRDLADKASGILVMPVITEGGFFVGGGYGRGALRFRRGSGWAAGGDIEYVFNDRGENLRAETTTSSSPVVAVIFGQAGLMAGVSLEGMKYTRIIP